LRNSGLLAEKLNGYILTSWGEVAKAIDRLKNFAQVWNFRTKRKLVGVEVAHGVTSADAALSCSRCQRAMSLFC
jgi:hypothetical protein